MLNEGGREDGTCGSDRGQGCSLVIFLFAAVLETKLIGNVLANNIKYIINETLMLINI